MIEKVDMHSGRQITSAVIEGLIEIINYSNNKMEINNIESILEVETISDDSVELGFLLDILVKKSDKILVNNSEKYSSSDFEEIRRNIIFSLVEKQPTFLASVVNCTARCIKTSGSSRIVQIISDANLSHPLDGEGEHWWWNIQSILRARRHENENTEGLEDRGRLGEQLSKAYEKKRINDLDGSMVEIVSAIDGDRKGYDILSYQDVDKKERLRIEVKASKLDVNTAKIHLTWNEWNVANQFGYHEFHLWPNLETPSASPLIVSLERMRKYIPETEKGVVWPKLEIQMKLLIN